MKERRSCDGRMTLPVWVGCKGTGGWVFKENFLNFPLAGSFKFKTPRKSLRRDILNLKHREIAFGETF